MVSSEDIMRAIEPLSDAQREQVLEFAREIQRDDITPPREKNGRAYEAWRARFEQRSGRVLQEQRQRLVDAGIDPDRPITDIPADMQSGSKTSVTT